MKNQTVVSNEYIQLQEAIIAKQNEWKEKLTGVTGSVSESKRNREIPFILQAELKVNEEELVSLMDELVAVLQEQRPELNEELDKVRPLIKVDTVKEWIQEAIAMNELYFTNVAEQNGLSAWLPYFIAESATRPVLQTIAASNMEQLASMEVKGACPCCGEPPRLAELNKIGRKMLICPRCHATWGSKKISCAYCGSEEHEKLTVLQVEGRDAEELHVCAECNGYTKVIHTNKFLDKVDPAMMDLNTIHLDYIAQEKGYVQAPPSRDNIQ